MTLTSLPQIYCDTVPSSISEMVLCITSLESDDPAFLVPGTEVSAKFKGAFCEAKIKKICKSVKCKIALKEAPFGSMVVEEHLVKGTLEVNQTVDVCHGKHSVKGVIQHVKDCIFNDGDEKVLRRTQMCLKGAKHFDTESNLDQMPLYNPEQFCAAPKPQTKTKKIKKPKRRRDEDSEDEEGKKRKKRAAASAANVAIGEMDHGDTEGSGDGDISGSEGESSDGDVESEKEDKKKKDKKDDDEKKEDSSRKFQQGGQKGNTDRLDEKTEKFPVGSAVCAYEDSQHRGKWFPAVIVNPKAFNSVISSANVIRFEEHCLNKKAMDTMSAQLRTAIDRINSFVSKGTLPNNWTSKGIYAENVPRKKHTGRNDSQKVNRKSENNGSGKRDDDSKKKKATEKKVDSNSSSSEESGEEEYGEERDLFVLCKLRLEGCPGATPATVRKAYIRYLAHFNSVYKRLGWSLDELSMTSTINSPRERRLIRPVELLSQSTKKRKGSTAEAKEKTTKKGREKIEDRESKEASRDPEPSSHAERSLCPAASTSLEIVRKVDKEEGERKNDRRAKEDEGKEKADRKEKKDKSKDKEKEEKQKEKDNKGKVKREERVREVDNNVLDQVLDCLEVKEEDVAPMSTAAKPGVEALTLVDKKERRDSEREGRDNLVMSDKDQSVDRKDVDGSDEDGDGKRRKERKKLAKSDRKSGDVGDSSKYKDPDEGYHPANISTDGVESLTREDDAAPANLFSMGDSEQYPAVPVAWFMMWNNVIPKLNVLVKNMSVKRKVVIHLSDKGGYRPRRVSISQYEQLSAAAAEGLRREGSRTPGNISLKVSQPLRTRTPTLTLSKAEVTQRSFYCLTFILQVLTPYYSQHLAFQPSTVGMSPPLCSPSRSYESAMMSHHTKNLSSSPSSMQSTRSRSMYSAGSGKESITISTSSTLNPPPTTIYISTSHEKLRSPQRLVSSPEDVNFCQLCPYLALLMKELTSLEESGGVRSPTNVYCAVELHSQFATSGLATTDGHLRKTIILVKHSCLHSEMYTEEVEVKNESENSTACLVTPHYESDAEPSGSVTPLRTDGEDNDKLSTSDNQSGGGRMMSPGRGRGSKRKRTAYNRHSIMVIDRKYIRSKVTGKDERKDDDSYGEEEEEEG
uniref:ARID domain-containing protein n=1 Tax=Angiostrongylus cantonensis TaxID=6313 RepID=A0A158P8S9_ANGCA